MIAYQLVGDIDGLLEMNNLGRLSGISESDRLRAFRDKHPWRRTRVAQRERRLAACHAVLDTAELLECILSHLDFPKKLHPGSFVGAHSAKSYMYANGRNPKTHKRVVIFSCLRVSKYWNSIITTSPMLKQCMWLIQPPSPVTLGRMSQSDFSRTAVAYKLQTSASLSIFARHRLAPVILNPILFPHSWGWQPCKGNPFRVLGDPSYGVCACWDKMNKFNVDGYGRFRYLVNQPHCTHWLYASELEYDVLNIDLLPISIAGPIPKASWQEMYLSNSPKDIQLRVTLNKKHLYKYPKRSKGRVMKWDFIEVMVKAAPLDVLYRLARKLYAMAQRRAAFGDLKYDERKKHNMRTKWLTDAEKALIVGDVGFYMKRRPFEY